jgi:hypothetical protein
MNRSAAGQLASLMPATGKALPFLFLSAQTSPQSYALKFVDIAVAYKWFCGIQEYPQQSFKASNT